MEQKSNRAEDGPKKKRKKKKEVNLTLETGSSSSTVASSAANSVYAFAKAAREITLKPPPPPPPPLSSAPPYSAHKKTKKKKRAGGKRKIISEDGVEEKVPHEKRWGLMFARLKVFHAQFGHCNVANRYPGDPKLGSWVSAQRRQLRIIATASAGSAALTRERMQKLGELGFEWATNKNDHSPWAVRYNDLKLFVEQFGHSQVPMKWEENPKLGHWMSKQRHDFKLRLRGESKRMSDEKIQLLNDVGFCWDLSLLVPVAVRDGPNALVPTADAATAVGDSTGHTSANANLSPSYSQPQVDATEEVMYETLPQSDMLAQVASTGNQVEYLQALMQQQQQQQPVQAAIGNGAAVSHAQLILSLIGGAGVAQQHNGDVQPSQAAGVLDLQQLKAMLSGGGERRQDTAAVSPEHAASLLEHEAIASLLLGGQQDHSRLAQLLATSDPPPQDLGLVRLLEQQSQVTPAQRVDFVTLPSPSNAAADLASQLLQRQQQVACLQQQQQQQQGGELTGLVHQLTSLIGPEAQLRQLLQQQQQQQQGHQLTCLVQELTSLLGSEAQLRQLLQQQQQQQHVSAPGAMQQLTCLLALQQAQR